MCQVSDILHNLILRLYNVILAIVNAMAPGWHVLIRFDLINSKSDTYPIVKFSHTEYNPELCDYAHGFSCGYDMTRRWWVWLICPYSSGLLHCHCHGVNHMTVSVTTNAEGHGCNRSILNSSSSGQNGPQFKEDIFRCIFANKNACILITISLKFVPQDPINNNRALV